MPPATHICSISESNEATNNASATCAVAFSQLLPSPVPLGFTNTIPVAEGTTKLGGPWYSYAPISIMPPVAK